MLKLVDQLDDIENLKFLHKIAWKEVELTREKFDENGRVAFALVITNGIIGFKGRLWCRGLCRTCRMLPSASFIILVPCSSVLRWS